MEGKKPSECREDERVFWCGDITGESQRVVYSKCLRLGESYRQYYSESRRLKYLLDTTLQAKWVMAELERYSRFELEEEVIEGISNIHARTVNTFKGPKNPLLPSPSEVQEQSKNEESQKKEHTRVFMEGLTSLGDVLHKASDLYISNNNQFYIFKNYIDNYNQGNASKSIPPHEEIVSYFYNKLLPYKRAAIDARKIEALCINTKSKLVNQQNIYKLLTLEAQHYQRHIYHNVNPKTHSHLRAHKFSQLRQAQLDELKHKLQITNQTAGGRADDSSVAFGGGEKSEDSGEVVATFFENILPVNVFRRNLGESPTKQAIVSPPSSKEEKVSKDHVKAALQFLRPVSGKR